MRHSRVYHGQLLDKDMSKTMKGQRSEFLAAAWLISGRRKGDRINRVVNKHQKKIGVTLLYVYKDGRCDFHGKD